MVPELIGMLGLNSLTFVKHLMIFCWKVLGLLRGGGGCAAQGCNAGRGQCGLMDGWLSSPKGWNGELPIVPGLLMGKPAPERKTGSCKRASPALSHGWLLGCCWELFSRALG